MRMRKRVMGRGAALGAGWMMRRMRGRSQRRRFDGQAVFVSGGSRGLGLILAREFARRGAHLIICARDVDELDAARKDLESMGAEVLARRCDITQRDQVEALVQHAIARFGAIDVLVNNAGVIQVGPLETMGERDFRQTLEVNLWGMIHCSRAVHPSMRERGRGRILDITSLGGLVAVPHLVPYCVSKFAAVGFSRGFGAEVERHGIRVTTAAPWLMRTGSFLHALAKGRREQEIGLFSLGASLPFVSMNADRAARKMVDACANGQRWITVGLPAKAVRLAVAFMPGVVAATSATISRLLPEPGYAGTAQAAEPGWKHRGWPARSIWTTLGERAARRNNEVPRAYH